MGGNDIVETITVKPPVELTSDTFASDINLRHVDFQGGVTSIYESTFWNCPKMEKIIEHKLAFSFGLCPSSILLIIKRPNLFYVTEV